ncbi:MAG: tetratricopeptide repeat protein [Candidatus Viridilinea halotolerans]|uniref:Tetratricopeptide repeat protein n=1 Tax=Candidatus Viridilinea halotolerans TaxID=2491704 RepID=A0A426TSE8_9CHLR|nr:MAG: tetratricopeptide repeat protein [Candidatus Viridilinea halotolerans]
MTQRSTIFPPLETRLARYLGDEAAATLVRGTGRDFDGYLALAQLAGARYTISTYLPRRLVARELRSTTQGPWLEWVEGALLFADVSGSTALAERLTALGREGAEVVTATLDRYFGTMIELIEHAQGDLLNFGGDALLVLFAGEHGACAATHTALRLLDQLADFTAEVPGIGTFPLTMHIGVAAGAVALVSAGPPQALRYSAMGATVRNVARAEGRAGKGELVLDLHAWTALADRADGVPLADGFVRVHALQPANLPPPPPAPPDPPAPQFSLEGMDLLCDQLDRLSPYLPSDLLSRILADPNRSRVEADLRPVTVIFAQVAGLSSLVESLPPDLAAAVVDALLRPMHAAVAQMGGFINKLDLAEEGDKIMAVFGAPVAHEDHAERAGRAALRMLHAGQTQVRTALAALIGPAHPALNELSMRIGLNTGNVFAGNVGTASRKEYTVMGDAVNVAARVMGAAAWDEIRCASATAALAGHALEFNDQQMVTLRGKSEPLALLRIVGQREAALAPDEQPLVPLIGRSAELAWLRGHLEGTHAGHGRAVRIQGEAGIGKTRLVNELLNEAPHFRLLMVRCLAFELSTPYAPWGGILRALCAIVGGDDQPTRHQKLSAVLVAAGISADDWLPLLAELVRLEAADSIVVRALDPGQRQERRFALLRDLLRYAAQQQPLLLLFDNLHWADQVSLDLWQYLTAQIAQQRILMLGLHRGEICWGSGPQGDHADRLELGPLSDEAAALLIAQLAGSHPLDATLYQRLVERAAGNPLFIEELLHAVGSHADSLDELPDSLNGLLLARIDRLDEPSRALLRVAAVVGQRFPVSIIHSIHATNYQGDFNVLLRRLLDLDAAELTATERERPERIHHFRHALLHEVAYQSLLYARRRELHRRIAEHLETIHAKELQHLRAQYASGGLVQIGRNGSLLSRAARTNSGAIFLLAHHYRLSDQPERAVPYLLLAGHTARDDYANDQAMQHYRWAIEALGNHTDDPYAWEAHEALGDVLCILGHYEEAINEYAALIDPALLAAGATPAMPPAVAAEVLRSWGDALEKQGRYREALERLRSAEAFCRNNLDTVSPLLLAAIYADMGQVLRRLGELDQALEICRYGLTRIRNDAGSCEDERIEADLQQLMGTLYAMRGTYDEARFHFGNALAAQESIDDLYGCARSHNNLGYLAQLQSDYARAVGHYSQAEQLARKISAKYILSSVLLNVGYGYYRLDRYAEAESACRDAMALCAAMGDQAGVAQADDTLGLIAYSRGDYDAAISAYRRALVIYRAQQSTYQEGNTLALLAVAHCARNEAPLAHELAQQALELARQSQLPQLEVEALNARAEAGLVASRDPARAAERDEILATAALHATNAATIAMSLGSKLDQGIALRLCGDIAAQRGQPFAEHFHAALALLKATNSNFEYARTLARLGSALAACNDPAAAAYLEQARTTFQAIGAQGELSRMG